MKINRLKEAYDKGNIKRDELEAGIRSEIIKASRTEYKLPSKGQDRFLTSKDRMEAEKKFYKEVVLFILGFTPVDIAVDAYSLVRNIKNGNKVDAVFDLVALIGFDIIGGLKYSDEAVDIARIGDKVDNVKDLSKYGDELIEVAAEHGDEVIKGASKALGDLSQASKYGIDTYGNLTKSLKGTGLQAHHIIEQRLADVLGISNTKSMLSVAVTKTEHQAFTNAWRKLIPYGTNYSTLTKTQIWNYAQEVYKDYPALLDAAKKTIFK